METAPDWESTTSNHTVAVSAWRELRITLGDNASVKEAAKWDLDNTSLMYSGVTLVIIPKRKNGTSMIFRKDHDVGREA